MVIYRGFCDASIVLGAKSPEVAGPLAAKKPIKAIDLKVDGSQAKSSIYLHYPGWVGARHSTSRSDCKIRRSSS